MGFECVIYLVWQASLHFILKIFMCGVINAQYGVAFHKLQ